MNPLQMEPLRPQGRRGGTMSPAQWLKQNVLTPPDGEISSLGEFLLPTLLGAMEACWIAAALIGLASAGMFSSTTPLLPFWAVFLYIIGTQWFFYLMDKRDENARRTPLFIFLAAVFCLFMLWLQIYSPHMALFDPRWLGALFSDVLFLNNHFYQAVFIIALSLILCWRGLRLMSRTIEPSMIFRTLCLGIVIIIVITALRAEIASTGAALHDDIILFLLVPVFLYLSLAAHALARIAFVRRTHTIGLQGSVVAQERAVMTVMGLLGAILLVITIIIAIFASPAFFVSALHTLAPVGAAIATAYDWFISLVAVVAVFIATPFFWLFNWIASLVPAKARSKPNAPIQVGTHLKKALPVSPAASPVLLFVLKLLVPALILLVLILLVRRALRKRKKIRRRTRQRDEDSHESLWSWALFWSQLRAFLRSLFGRFLPQPAIDGPVQAVSSVESADPAARDIRAVYRAFLKKAALRGYARKKDETPAELRQRLDEQAPLVEPQLEAITGAYVMVRYGESLPNADDVANVQGKWSELNQKWV